MAVHLMNDELKKCESEIMDSLIKHTSNTEEAHRILQMIEAKLDLYSKVVKGNE